MGRGLRGARGEEVGEEADGDREGRPPHAGPDHGGRQLGADQLLLDRLRQVVQPANTRG